MLIFRYLAKEVLLATMAILLVLMLIFMSGRFMGYLADAASGKIAADVLFTVMFYRMPHFIELILPLAFFLGVILTYGRLYVESEMAVLSSTGVSTSKLCIYTLIPALAVSLALAWFSMVLSPVGELRARAMLNATDVGSSLSTLLPGKFQVLKGSQRAFYAQELTDKGTRMSTVFLADSSQIGNEEYPRLTLILAEAGGVVSLDDSGESYLELYRGKQYRGNPGELDFQKVEFKRYGALLQMPEGSINKRPGSDSLATSVLLASDIAEHKATLQWRISLPLLLPIAALIAIGMSRTNQRRGRYTKLFPAILIYLAYYVALTLVREYMGEGSWPVWLGMWPVHLLALLTGLFITFGGQWWIRWRVGHQREVRT
ncbi:MAG: LPS export ABC transporter permease LptF [Pseudomonadales bacterium]